MVSRLSAFLSSTSYKSINFLLDFEKLDVKVKAGASSIKLNIGR